MFILLKIEKVSGARLLDFVAVKYFAKYRIFLR